jgi:hypothetical protein
MGVDCRAPGGRGSGYLKVVWPDLGGAFYQIWPAPGVRECPHKFEGLKPHHFEGPLRGRPDFKEAPQTSKTRQETRNQCVATILHPSLRFETMPDQRLDFVRFCPPPVVLVRLVEASLSRPAPDRTHGQGR